MKKKPAQCPRQGKSNNNIKSFLNNLKDNDLHFEENHITQCVFLGILRLKPVPSVFTSNKVPRVVVDNKSKRYRNNNSSKEVNKNISQKKDINKVISGKIRKKNPDRIKASVKKLPTKKPVIRIKLNIDKNKEESMFQNKRVNPNPPPTFNPVQNLFDKLKQQMDDKYRPSSSDINKETLFSTKISTDNQKVSKKTKKSNKKQTIHEMPSSSASFSDNTVNSKSNDDVIVINEDNGSDCEEVLINTGPMPNFVLQTAEKVDKNDIILIDDVSERSSPNLLLIDDTRTTRSSPRLNKSDESNVISLEENFQSTCEDISSKEKPRKRRTLLPSIPSIFFNAPMLLRSELAQKKIENRPNSRSSSSKLSKSDNNKEKSSVKQKKESKPRNSTENLIYEVVKSSAEQNVATSSNDAQKDVILVDRSPPKVEPLIIKLKVTQNKTANEKPVQENDKSKEKNCKTLKSNVTKVTKNLFFPRLLRSDVVLPKDDAESRKIAKSAGKVPEPPLATFYGKLSVKPDSFLKESPEKLLPNIQPLPDTNPTFEIVEKTSNEPSSSTERPRRLLRSDIAQKPIHIDDESESDPIITIEDNSTTASIEISPAESLEKSTESEFNQRQLGVRKELSTTKISSAQTRLEFEDAQEQLEESVNSTPRQLRSVGTHKDSEIIDVDKEESSEEKTDNPRSETLRVASVDLTEDDSVPIPVPVVEEQAKNWTESILEVVESNSEESTKKSRARKKIFGPRRQLRSDLVQKASGDQGANLEQSKNEIVKTSAEKIEETISDKEPIRRHLRTEVTSFNERVTELADSDGKLNVTDGSKRRRKESISKRLDIDLIDYEDQSVDTATPRQLRSENLQKKLLTKEIGTTNNVEIVKSGSKVVIPVAESVIIDENSLGKQKKLPVKEMGTKNDVGIVKSSAKIVIPVTEPAVIDDNRSRKQKKLPIKEMGTNNNVEIVKMDKSGSKVVIPVAESVVIDESRLRKQKKLPIKEMGTNNNVETVKMDKSGSKVVIPVAESVVIDESRLRKQKKLPIKEIGTNNDVEIVKSGTKVVIPVAESTVIDESRLRNRSISKTRSLNVERLDNKSRNRSISKTRLADVETVLNSGNATINRSVSNSVTAENRKTARGRSSTKKRSSNSQNVDGNRSIPKIRTSKSLEPVLNEEKVENEDVAPEPNENNNKSTVKTKNKPPKKKTVLAFLKTKIGKGKKVAGQNGNRKNKKIEGKTQEKSPVEGTLKEIRQTIQIEAKKEETVNATGTAKKLTSKTSANKNISSTKKTKLKSNKIRFLKPKKSLRSKSNTQRSLRSNTDTSQSVSIKSSRNEPRKTQKSKRPTKKLDDLDEIVVIQENTTKKQKYPVKRTLRSSILSSTVKEEPAEAPVVEKVVALIHSEPKSKYFEENSAQKPEKPKVKPRILRSQNLNHIETIEVVEEELTGRKDKMKKNIKKGTKTGVSEKSKVIKRIKKDNIKKLRLDVKSKVVENKKSCKVQTSKKTVLQQVKTKLKTNKNVKSPNTKKKTVPKQRRMINWHNDEIIERIIQEIKNTIFKQDGIEVKNQKGKKQVPKKEELDKPSKKDKKMSVKNKNIAKLSKKNRKVIQEARKRILQTKKALQRKLRSAINAETDEANTSGSSESKENNPPNGPPQKTKLPNTETIKEETIVQVVDSYLEEMKSDKMVEEKNTNDSIIIINEVTVQSNGNIIEKGLKRKATELPDLTAQKKQNTTNTPSTDTDKFVPSPVTEIDVKTNDITVFDFDETEPEVGPLRHKIAPKEVPIRSQVHTTPEKIVPALSETSPSRLKLNEVSRTYQTRGFPENLDKTMIDDDVTRKRLVENTVDKSNKKGEKTKVLVPIFDEEGKPRKLWSTIPKPKSPDTSTSKLWSVIQNSESPNSPPTAGRPKTLDISTPSTSTATETIPSDTSDKKSPLKQPTIIEMFSKVWMKQEKPLPVKNLTNEDDIFTNRDPPPAPSPRRDLNEDDDSDTESRAEWIPEEYAEYKIKYSAQKMMQYKPSFKCKICLVTMSSYYRLLKHRREHEKKEKPYSCPHCSSEFKEFQEFSAHLRVHKGKHPYVCRKCDIGFWTKKAHDAHAPIHILKKAKPPVKKFRCDVCAKEFSKLCDVERHTRVHTGEKPCICNICNKRFQQSHNLSKHLLTHLQLKPFSCEICNKQFGRHDVLRRHMLTHSVEKPAKCSICLRGFIRHIQLLQHYKTKHPDHPIDELVHSFEEMEGSSGLKNENGTPSVVK